MLAVAVQTKKSPVQILGLIGLLSFALGGYILFSTMHLAKAQDLEGPSSYQTTLTKDSFLMFMHPEQSTVNFISSNSFTGQNIKFLANTKRKFAFNDFNRLEKTS